MSKKIGVKCKQSDLCARPSSGGEMEVGELSEVEGVVKSSEPEPGINR